MVGVLTQNITVYKKGKLVFTFPFITSCNISSSRENFTDTAILEFPRKTYTDNRTVLDFINVGDSIKIELGYSGYLEKTVFEGYISKIKNDTSIIIKVEDDAFIYKSQIIEPKVFKKTTLKEILTFYYKGVFVTTNADIGTWIVNENVTLIDMFDELRQKLGVLSYWQNGILYVGAEIEKRASKIVVFDINKNVPTDTDNIQLEGSDDIGVISCGISTQKNGKTIKRYAYYKDAAHTEIITTSIKPLGSINTMKRPNLTQSKLDYWIIRRLPNLYTNINLGDITTFGIPVFEHGDLAKVINSKDKGVNGVYDIVGVDKTFDTSTGYKQTAKIGLKIKNIS